MQCDLRCQWCIRAFPVVRSKGNAVDREFRREFCTYASQRPADEHGTFAWCASADRDLYDISVASILTTGNRIAIQMHTTAIEGELQAESGRIEGIFIRGETKLPLILT